MQDMYTEVDARFTKDRTKMRSREVAYESIKHAILSGILVPWERLVEERLGDALQLSRTPVREALSILEHEGLIESVPYKGLMVKPVTVDEFISMYEALGVIEPAIAAGRRSMPRLPTSGSWKRVLTRPRRRCRMTFRGIWRPAASSRLGWAPARTARS